jgi:hypothetical protein
MTAQVTEHEVRCNLYAGINTEGAMNTCLPAGRRAPEVSPATSPDGHLSSPVIANRIIFPFEGEISDLTRPA